MLLQNEEAPATASTLNQTSDGPNQVPPGHFKDWPNNLGFQYTPQNNSQVELKVTGKFPPWASGKLLRIGPGVYEVGRENNEDGVFRTSHWFDGFTTCHKFDISTREDGSSKVLYMSKGQVDDQLEMARRAGDLRTITFGQKRDPCDSFYKKVKTFFQPNKVGSVHSLNTGVAFAPSNHVKGQNVISTLSDRIAMKEIDIDTLEPKTVTTQSDLNSSLKGQMSAAHSEVDPETGDVYNYNLELGPIQAYRIFKVRADNGKTEVLATIIGPDVRGAYIHSFFLTKNFFILCVWPAFIGAKGISILWERNILDAIEPFNKNAKCTWYVVDRTGGRGLVKKFTSPAMFSFHTANAWEVAKDDGTVDIIGDIVQFDNLDILHRMYYENLVSNGTGKTKSLAETPAFLARYRLTGVPLSAKVSGVTKKGVAEKVFSIESPDAGDLPTFNPEYKCKPSRYVYSITSRGLSSFIDAICKTDTETQTAKLWSCDKHTPGEAIFIANPEAKSEDDGVLLTVVLDGIKGTSYLLCLDAATLEEVARAECEVPVSFGFHGVHLASKA